MATALAEDGADARDLVLRDPWTMTVRPPRLAAGSTGPEGLAFRREDSLTPNPYYVGPLIPAPLVFNISPARFAELEAGARLSQEEIELLIYGGALASDPPGGSPEEAQASSDTTRDCTSNSEGSSGSAAEEGARLACAAPEVALGRATPARVTRRLKGCC